jgi:pimeloyl-ACP methyl ester carboxylesterase
MTDDVLAVLDATGIEQTHYFGYSMGCMVGFRLALRYPEHFRSFILAGNTPYSFPEIAVKGLRGIIEMRKQQINDPDAYIQKMESQIGRPFTKTEKNVRLSGDPQALVAAIEGLLNWTPLTNDDLSRISKPCLVYCGEEDEGGFHNATKDCVNHMPNAKYISFPGLGHLQAQFNLDTVLPPIKEFLESVDK